MSSKQPPAMQANTLETSPGTPFPFGATPHGEEINFAISAKNVQKLSLCLFDLFHLDTPSKEIELDPAVNKSGDVWHIRVKGLTPSAAYGFRLTPQGVNKKPFLLLDPYAKEMASHHTWGTTQLPYQPLGKIVSLQEFDWQGDRHPRTKPEDLVIYEMHVRGFTQDPSSEVKFPGTFLGVIEKIPYLKDLGINAVELMPIHEFNESEVTLVNPTTKGKLHNYFGYSTVNFFSPMNRYANQSAIEEFKTMVRELHKNGIEVILDVVYNHTGEGNMAGPIYSFRGLNLSGYYMVDNQGNYLNYSGCGNTFNTNHPWAFELILSSLRYWVTEMHVDGFRFDLASIFSRTGNDPHVSRAPIIEAISSDPILADTKLIAEAWDAAGLYQVGSFYPGDRWAEWNGHYRDVVRRFIKGTPGNKTAFATALCGSQDLYGWGRSPTCSINFITAHDGFSLADLVTYNEKHNKGNGESNRDGCDHNDSWNCGVEGHSTNKKIVLLRERQIRNFILALMVSQGTPMVLMGDEYAHSRHGNNNTWCQDNELNWFLWDQIEARPGFNRFFKNLIEFRKTHPQFKRGTFLNDKDITWHGLTPSDPDWGNDNHIIAFTLETDGHPDIYVAFNASHQRRSVTLPATGAEKEWRWVVNTHNQTPNDFFDKDHRARLMANPCIIPAYSAIMLEAVPGN